MLWSASWLKRLVRPVSFKSTMGVSPETVTVSCTAEISIALLKRAFSPNWMRTPSTTIVLKPASSYLTLYVPTARPGN